MIEETIKSLNERIANGNNTVNCYSITEMLKQGGNTILTEIDTGNMVSIDDAYNAVVWHRLMNANLSVYAGRGAVEQYELSHKVKLLCYSKNLKFYAFICSMIAKDNTLSLKRIDFNKKVLIDLEIPEVSRNFNNEHFFFAIEYEAKGIIDSKCFEEFCF